MKHSLTRYMKSLSKFIGIAKYASIFLAACLPHCNLAAKCAKCEKGREQIHYFFNSHKSDLSRVPGAVADNNWMKKPWKAHWWSRMPQNKPRTEHMEMHHGKDRFKKQQIDCMVCTGNAYDYDCEDMETLVFDTTIGTSQDEDIAGQLRDLLIEDGRLSWNAKLVHVKAINGHITLSGAVNDAQSKQLLTYYASQCDNVQSVDNNVHIIPSQYFKSARDFQNITKEPRIVR